MWHFIIVSLFSTVNISSLNDDFINEFPKAFASALEKYRIYFWHNLNDNSFFFALAVKAGAVKSFSQLTDYDWETCVIIPVRGRWTKVLGFEDFLHSRHKDVSPRPSGREGSAAPGETGCSRTVTHVEAESLCLNINTSDKRLQMLRQIWWCKIQSQK